MSLLMEALRKAEAAKNKADGKEVDEKSQLSLEPKEAEETAPPVRESSRNRTTETTKNAAPESYEFKLEARPPADSGRKQTNTETSGPDAALTEDFSFSDDAFNNANTSSVKGILSVDVSQNETDPGNFLDQNDPAEDHIDLNLSGINAFDYTEAYDKDKEKTQNEILETLDKQAGADELYGYIPEESIQGDTAEVITDSAYEALEVAKELNEYERSRTQPGETRFKADQAVLDRQTASSLFRAKKNSRADRRNRVIVLGLLIALLPIGGGGFYWYYSSSLNNNSLFPVNAEFTPPPTGFLGEVPPAAILAETETPPATDENTALSPVTEDRPLNLDTGIAINAEQELTDPAIAPENPPPVATTTAQAVTTNPVIPGPTIAIQTNNGGDIAASNTPALTVTEIKLTRTSSRREINPDLLAAYESYQQSDFNQARRLYSQVLNTQANNRDALLGLALINRQEGNIAQAQALYSRLLQLNPRDPLARAGLLQSSQGANSRQQESELKALQSEFPNVAPLAFALGNLFASQARWNEAQNAYFDALLIATEVDSGSVSPDYAFNLAVSLERLNQLNLAYSYYRQALELSSTSPSGFSMDNLNQRLAYLEQVLQ